MNKIRIAIKNWAFRRFMKTVPNTKQETFWDKILILLNKIDYYALAKWRSIFKEWDFAENKSILFNLGFNFMKVGIGIRLEYGKHYLWEKSKWKVLAFTARFLIFKLQIGYSWKKEEKKNEGN